MPYIISDSRRGVRVLAIAIALALAAITTTAPAHAAGIANPYDCTPQATLSRPSRVGATTASTPRWTTPASSTARRAGRSPARRRGERQRAVDDRRRLAHELARRSRLAHRPSPRRSASTATYPYFRLFAKNASITKSTLKIDVLFYDGKGNIVTAAPYSYITTSTAWQPTGTVKISVFTPKTTIAAAPVSFRFTPVGPTARYQIDDVYVDPWARG